MVITADRRLRRMSACGPKRRFAATQRYVSNRGQSGLWPTLIYQEAYNCREVHDPDRIFCLRRDCRGRLGLRRIAPARGGIRQGPGTSRFIAPEIFSRRGRRRGARSESLKTALLICSSVQSPRNIRICRYYHHHAISFESRLWDLQVAHSIYSKSSLHRYHRNHKTRH